MFGVSLVCVGKMREPHYVAAFNEYSKRLAAFCKFELIELTEQRLPDQPSEKQIESALAAEAAEIIGRIPKAAYVIAMCVEGRGMSSEALAELIDSRATAGVSRLCFVVGGSFGLHESVKAVANLRLSMSDMTFPHHLARVMLAEQVYRAFSINLGSRYHK